MTDELHESDFDRETDALRRALADQAAPQPQPLSATELKARAGRPGARGWLAAVASLVLVVGAGAAVLPGLRERFTSQPASGEISAQDAAASSAEAESVPNAADDALPQAEPGFRWESFADVVVQVPDGWGYATSPGADWCAATGATDGPDGPYVDLARGLQPVLAIGCSQDPADPDSSFDAAAQQMHLSFAVAAEDQWRPIKAPFQRYSQTVGDVVVSVDAIEEEEDLARQILDSARIVTADNNGCPVSAPEDYAVEVTATGTATCLYDLTRQGANLVASVALDESGSEALVAAMDAAPEGEGPDGTAQQCLPGPGDQVAYLILQGRALRFDFAGCTGNGLTTSSGSRVQVTAGICQAAFHDPVRIFSGSAPMPRQCLSSSR